MAARGCGERLAKMAQAMGFEARPRPVVFGYKSKTWEIVGADKSEARFNWWVAFNATFDRFYDKSSCGCCWGTVVVPKKAK